MTVYSPCASGSSVELYTIVSGKHAWPGGEAVNLVMGEPNMEISATAHHVGILCSPPDALVSWMDINGDLWIRSVWVKSGGI